MQSSTKLGVAAGFALLLGSSAGCDEAVEEGGGWSSSGPGAGGAYNTAYEREYNSCRNEQISRPGSTIESPWWEEDPWGG